MFKLSELKNTTRKVQSIKRVGRGPGSGLGKTCGRGTKGYKAYSASNSRRGYEGGQTRTYLKFPIRGGKTERFRMEHVIFNLFQIEINFKDGDTVTPEALLSKKLTTLSELGFANQEQCDKSVFHVKHHGRGLKILGKGQLTKKVTVKAHAFSPLAQKQIEKAGGKCILIPKAPVYTRVYAAKK